jgi:malate permease and related proteins
LETLVFSFQVVVILLAVGIVAYWIVRRVLIPTRILAFLTTVAINIALPSLVFASIASEFNFEDYSDWWLLPLWWVGFSLVAIALTLLFMFISKKEVRREFAISLFFQNALFFPLIILRGLFSFGQAYVIQLILFTFLQPSLVFSSYYLFFGKPPPGVRWKRLLNPVLVLTLAAFLVNWVGIKRYLPDFIIILAVLLGAISAPLLIIVLGGSIYNKFRSRTRLKGSIRFREILKFVAIKNIVFPLVFLGLLILIKPDFPIAIIIILQSAVPPITAIPILTERSGGNQGITDQFLVGSFIFSVVTIPAVLYLFSLFFPFP